MGCQKICYLVAFVAVELVAAGPDAVPGAAVAGAWTVPVVRHQVHRADLGDRLQSLVVLEARVERDEV